MDHAKSRVGAVLAIALLFIWFIGLLTGLDKSISPAVGLPFFYIPPVAAMLLALFFVTDIGGGIWIPPAIGIMLVWLVLVIARVNLPVLSGPVVHILPVLAVLAVVFRSKLS